MKARIRPYFLSTSQESIIGGQPTSEGIDWYSGSIYYSFKNVVLEGMSSLRGVVEISNILEQHYGEQIPKNWYLITDCGGDQRVEYDKMIK